jgi:hypothetical protein
MEAIDAHPGILLIALVVFSVVLAVFVAWLFFTLRKYQRRYRNINTAAEAGDLAEVMALQSDEIVHLQNKLAQMERDQNHLGHNQALAVQKVGLIRFDAFDDVGGKLSFAMAFMDDRGDGIILSSINGRQDSRVYAKPVKGGESVFNLSIEEREAIGQALR